MDLLLSIIGFFLVVAISGSLLFLCMYTWLGWFTDGNFKESRGKKKSYITIIVVGSLAYFLIYNQ